MTTGEGAQHFRIHRPLEGAAPELREKLARQLHKIGPDEPEAPQDDASCGGEAVSDKPDETDAAPFGGCGMEDESDEAEVSDADSEPLEYAMLEFAGTLGGEASAVLDKVRREHEKNQRLKQELASVRRASMAAERSRALTAESLSEGKEPAERQPSGGLEEDDRTDLPEAVAATEEPSEPADGEPEAEAEVEEPEDEAVEAEDEAEVEEEAAPSRRACCGLLSWRWAAFWTLLAAWWIAQQGPEALAQQLLPQFPGAAELLDDAAGAPLGAAGEAFDTLSLELQDVEDRLRRAREFRRRREVWLGGAARVAVVAVAAAALLCLSLALLCWRHILGAVVAVAAGAVLFVLAILAADAAQLLRGQG